MSWAPSELDLGTSLQICHLFWDCSYRNSSRQAKLVADWVSPCCFAIKNHFERVSSGRGEWNCNNLLRCHIWSTMCSVQLATTGSDVRFELVRQTFKRRTTQTKKKGSIGVPESSFCYVMLDCFSPGPDVLRTTSGARIQDSTRRRARCRCLLAREGWRSLRVPEARQRTEKRQPINAAASIRYWGNTELPQMNIAPPQITAFFDKQSLGFPTIAWHTISSVRRWGHCAMDPLRP